MTEYHSFYCLSGIVDRIAWRDWSHRLYMQEALRPQRDRATRYVSLDLVHSCAAMGTSCTTNPQLVAVMELEANGWQTCSKPSPRVDRRRYRQQTRPSTSFCWQRDWLTCRGKNFQVQSLGHSSRKKYSNFFITHIRTYCLPNRPIHDNRHFICPTIQQYAHLHRHNFRRAGQQGPTRTLEQEN